MLVQLKAVNVIYGQGEGKKERVVLDKVDWTIREGERWVLAGHNGKSTSDVVDRSSLTRRGDQTGSGKSTLLSVVLGDHPRSFQEDVTMFGRERYRQATATSELFADLSLWAELTFHVSQSRPTSATSRLRSVMPSRGSMVREL